MTNRGIVWKYNRRILKSSWLSGILGQIEKMRNGGRLGESRKSEKSMILVESQWAGLENHLIDGLGWKLDSFFLSCLFFLSFTSLAAILLIWRLERAAENVSTTWSDGPSSTYLLLVLLWKSSGLEDQSAARGSPPWERGAATSQVRGSQGLF